LKIFPIPALKDNYIWALMNHIDDVWVVDPGEATPVINFLKQKKATLQGILVTHHHWDHTGGVSALREKFDIPVYGPSHSPFLEITHHFANESVVELVSDFPRFKMIAIPGHTLDHVAYYTDGSLFCGDTLFAGGCGRVFEGTMSQMYHSLQRLMQLPSLTKVYCAHEYTLANLAFAQQVEPANQAISARIERVKKLIHAGLPSLPSSLEEELETNPFLRCERSEVQARVIEMVGQTIVDPIEVFEYLRNWKNGFV
jgi:hydroxyacylglutathione hydrolase